MTRERDPMTAATDPAALARLAARHLLAASAAGRFPEYVRRVYGYEPAEDRPFDRVYVVEVTGGDFDRGTVSSVPVRWWEVSADGAAEVEAPDMGPFNRDSDLGRPLCLRPIVSIYVRLPDVLCWERVGPRLRCARAVTVGDRDGGSDIVAERVINVINAA